MKLAELLQRPLHFLMLGECKEELAVLKQAKCTGIAVAPAWGALDDEAYYGEIRYIEGHLSTEPHFTRTLTGCWIKPITPKDIFDQWGSERFDLIIIDVPSLTRYMWYSPQVQVHMPKYHLLKDDGHNESLIEAAHKMYYGSRKMEGDWLLLAK